MALRKVWLDQIDRQQYIHASIQATLYNTHFDNGSVPWTAEDFLGRGDREHRILKSLSSKVATSRIAQGGRPVPEWALEAERTAKGRVN